MKCPDANEKRIYKLNLTISEFVDEFFFSGGRSLIVVVRVPKDDSEKLQMQRSNGHSLAWKKSEPNNSDALFVLFLLFFFPTYISIYKITK